MTADHGQLREALCCPIYDAQGYGHGAGSIVIGRCAFNVILAAAESTLTDERRLPPASDTLTYGGVRLSPGVTKSGAQADTMTATKLTEVRMPKEYDEAAIQAMLRCATYTPNLSGRGLMECLYRALYDYLAAPKTKMVEKSAWGVADGNYFNMWFRKEDAERDAQGRAGAAVFELTGKAEVPA